MPELKLYCDRPLFRKIDLQTARFVVSTANGLTVNGVKLSIGEEVPSGALTTYALQCEYEKPLRRIELVEYAFKDSLLRSFCEERGVSLSDPTPIQGASPDATSPAPGSGATPEQEDTDKDKDEAPKPQIITPDLEAMDLEELTALCGAYQLGTHGNARQLRKRIREFWSE